MNQLEQSALRTGKKVFLNFRSNESAPPQDIQLQTVFVETVRSWSRMQESLPKQPGEIPELFLDRVMLARSLQYRLTRSLSRKAGISLVPRFRMQIRTFREFDPLDSQIYYSPLASEFEWIFSDDQLSVRKRCIAIQELFHCMTSSFHDLNHALFTRMVQVKSLDANYWALNEALATIRDTHATAELGTATRILRRLGILYRDTTGPSFPANAEEFAGFILSVQGAALGMPKTEVRRLLKTAGVVRKPEWEKILDREFVDDIIPKWQIRIRKIGCREIPATNRSSSLPILRLENVDPRHLAGNPEILERMWRWYNQGFSET